jgi:carbonic anhydrase/acetyltransferase-like protein (isoleucine patch superfamily)
VVIHGTFEKAATEIGNHVSIGHNALVHGCTLQDNVLIGMGAIVMDNSIVEEKSIVAAGAVVLENTIVESGSIYAGVPAKKVKEVNPALFEGEIQRIAQNYVLYSSWYQK